LAVLSLECRELTLSVSASFPVSGWIYLLVQVLAPKMLGMFG